MPLALTLHRTVRVADKPFTEIAGAAALARIANTGAKAHRGAVDPGLDPRQLDRVFDRQVTILEYRITHYCQTVPAASLVAWRGPVMGWWALLLWASQ